MTDAKLEAKITEHIENYLWRETHGWHCDEELSKFIVKYLGVRQEAKKFLTSIGRNKHLIMGDIWEAINKYADICRDREIKKKEAKEAREKAATKYLRNRINRYFPNYTSNVDDMNIDDCPYWVRIQIYSAAASGEPSMEVEIKDTLERWIG